MNGTEERSGLRLAEEDVEAGAVIESSAMVLEENCGLDFIA